MPRHSLDNVATQLRTIGPTTWWGNPHFHHPWYVRNCLCPDGKRRTAYLGNDADTYFSWPAKVKYGGTWYNGFVTTNSDPDDTVFTANREE